MKTPNNVEEYIQSFPKETQKSLYKIREIILLNTQNVTEGISYGMPAYKINNKPFIYFAGYNKHIGLYALPEIHKKFAKKLSIYKQGKGSVQFPINQEIPFDLIIEIVKYKVSSFNVIDS